jgi:hypothetical protein
MSQVIQSFKECYGYPIWYPWAFAVLVLTGARSFAATFCTMNISWFLLTLVVALVMGAAAKG